MYDVLFIDDKFEEIKDTFFDLQREHIRCFYSDGKDNLPQNNKEKLPFKNLKYICLDLHLENLGITTLKNKNAVSTLSAVVKSFIDESNTDIHIIINTLFTGEFSTAQKDFIKYLGFTPKITTEEKKEDDSKKYSTLYKQEIKKDIKKTSHQSILRNLVIREAIEIENLIWGIIEERFVEIIQNSPKETIANFKKGFHFSHKITLFNMFNSNLSGELKNLRELRNKFAHDNELPQKDLLVFLEETEKLKERIQQDKKASIARVKQLLKERD